jgi:hypothetical protein
MDAIQSAEWAVKVIERVKGKRPWTQLNLLVIDTCATQLNTGFRVSQYQDLKHLFVIGCDSHGI